MLRTAPGRPAAAWIRTMRSPVFVVGIVAERGGQPGESLVGFGGFEEFGDDGPDAQGA